MTNTLLTTAPDRLGTILSTKIDEYIRSQNVSLARVGQRYYNQDNDIENTRIMWMNDHGDIVEDDNASNIKISHGFFAELVDQKTQYLLANGIDVKPTDHDDQKLCYLIEEYYNEEFQSAIQELVEGSTIKGYEGIFARTTSEDKLTFQTVDALQLLPVFDDYGTLQRIIRFYTEQRYSDADNKFNSIGHADVWTDTEVWYYVQKDEGRSDEYVLDTTVNPNPSQHVLAVADGVDEAILDEGVEEHEGRQVLGRSYKSRFPFDILYNNKLGISDIKKVKSIIDDYDLMNCFLSNNLQDMAEAIYVVRGGTNSPVDEIKKNIQSKKIIQTKGEGGLDIQTVDIPYEARKAKMDIDELNIYRSGMGFNSSAVGDGNATNVVIKSRYTLLAMKAQKTEIALRKTLRWTADLVVEDIRRRGLGDYSSTDIKFDIEPYILANELDLAMIDKTEAETNQIQINNLLAIAPRIGDEETLKAICDTLDLDYEDVVKALEDQEVEELEPTVTPIIDPLTIEPQPEPLNIDPVIEEEPVQE
ncbi:gp3 [Listeria phage P40]|uniref:portal protein n=1 Tax=Listeria phage P40 TaxID=560178 RepID=UPI00018198BA|nr:portal protein [Listeria phage P40]ACI00363.1 gp3 [Listeria phage P40]